MKQHVSTTVIGSYPIIPDAAGMMQGYFEGKPLEWHPCINEAVSDMVSAGIGYVSDGQTRDPFIQIYTRKLSGCRIRARTEIIGKVEYAGPITVADQQYVKTLLPRHTKLLGLLTGPFTLMKSSVDLYYHDDKQLCFDFADALRKEAEALQPYVDLISIDEPFFSNEYPEYATELIGTITKNLKCPTRLHACGDVSRIVPHLLELPVDILSHEFKASPHLFDAFAQHPSKKKICVGAVRSDAVAVEPVEEIVSHLKHAWEVFGENIHQIAPDCGQRMLPRDVAFQKLKNLVTAKEKVYGR